MKKTMSSLKYVLWLLERRDRSIAEIEEKLRRKDYDRGEIGNTINFLVSKNLLNDQRFAENFIRYKKNIKPVGKFYLRNKLLEKKIPVEIIEKVLSETPDEPSEIEELAESWLTKNKKVPRDKIYEKLSRHLISRGFEWEKAREVVDEKLQK